MEEQKRPKDGEVIHHGIVYKSPEQARKELEAINPKLLEKFEIRDCLDRGGVQLDYKGHNIWANMCSYEIGSEGLWELMIKKDGKDFKELFGTDRIAGGLTLEQAVVIAEAAEHLSENALRGLAKEYFSVEY